LFRQKCLHVSFLAKLLERSRIVGAILETLERLLPISLAARVQDRQPKNSLSDKITQVLQLVRTHILREERGLALMNQIAAAIVYFPQESAQSLSVVRTAPK
jgi:hypothetical protein